MKEELSKATEKEYIFRFGLERFSTSPKDINFYTGFPDYETLVAFWQYIEPNAANLTYSVSVQGMLLALFQMFHFHVSMQLGRNSRVKELVPNVLCSL